MRLLGERNWYLPRWLAWLPDVQVEGPRPEAPAADAPKLPPDAVPAGS
jgi:RND superfamily putative drug exporter